MNALKNPTATRAYLCAEEGRDLTIYPCSEGHPTIGVGHNLDAKPWILSASGERIRINVAKAKAGGLQITDRQADLMFEADLAAAVAATRKKFTWWDRLDEVRQAALVGITFQAGPQPGVTMDMVEHGQYAEAAARLLAKWELAKQTPERAERLAAMIEHGQWLPGYGG